MRGQHIRAFGPWVICHFRRIRDAETNGFEFSVCVCVSVRCNDIPYRGRNGRASAMQIINPDDKNNMPLCSATECERHGFMLLNEYKYTKEKCRQFSYYMQLQSYVPGGHYEFAENRRRQPRVKL